MRWLRAAWRGVQEERLLRLAERGFAPHEEACASVYLRERHIMVLVGGRWLNVYPGDPPTGDAWITAAKKGS